MEGTGDANLFKAQLDIYLLAAKESNPYLQQRILTSRKKESDEILEARDKFIAQQIDKTLPSDKIEILFIGRDHRVIEKLPLDIEVKIIEAKEEELPLSLRRVKF